MTHPSARRRPRAPLPPHPPAPHAPRLPALLLGAALAWGAEARAQVGGRAQGGERAPSFQRTETRAAWQLDDGLPQSSVTGIAPAADGRLWVATFAGLTRFDGVTFEPFKPTRGEAPIRVSHLAADPSDPRLIWVGTDAEGLWRLEDHERPEEVRLTRVPLSANALSLVIYEITVAPAGSAAAGLWLSTSRGTHHVHPDGRDEQVLVDDMFHAALAPDDHLWLCSASDLWLREPRGALRAMTRPTRPLPGGALPACRGGLPAGAGDYWSLYEDGLWLISRSGARAEVRARLRGEQAPRPVSVNADWRAHLARSSRGELLALTAQGLLNLGDEGEARARAWRGEPVDATLTPLGGPPRVSWLSPAGSLWVGLTGRGLMRLSEDTFQHLRWPEARDEQGAGPLTRLGGELWFAHNCKELWRARTPLSTPGALAAQVIERLSLPPSAHTTCVDALGARGSSELLVARELELLRLKEGGEGFERLLGGDDLAELHNVSLLAPRGARRGDWWVGSRGGVLARLSEGAPLVREALPPEVAGAWLLSLAELAAEGGAEGGAEGSAQGSAQSGPERAVDIVVGHGLGVSVRRGGAWRTFTSRDGLPEGAARHVVEAPDGVLWVATYGGGLGWVRGDRAGRLPLRRGELTDPYLSSITLGGDGQVWLQGNKGLTRASLSDLTRAIDAPELPITARLLRVGEANGWLRPSAALTPEGDLWLAGVAGVTVAPVGAPLNPEPLPPPRLTHASVGDTPLRLSGETRVRADEFRRLEARYSAVLLEPQEAVSYEHRLHDLSEPAPPWSPAGRASVTTYPRLAPGRYRLEVRSVSLERAPSAPVSVTFEVSAALHERPLTRALGALGALLLTALVGARRTRAARRHGDALRAEIEQRRAVEARLALSESHYRQVFNEAANAFLLYTQDGRCVEVNEQACALFGGAREALLAAPARALGLPPLDRLAEHEGGGRAPLLCARLDGATFPARMSYAPCLMGEERGWLLSVMDLSALISAQERQAWVQHQLAVARRMDALGRLASGVAHDLNNILGALSGNIELLGEELPPDDAFVQESLKDVRESVVRGGALSQQLLAFSRRKSKQRGVEVSPGEVLRGLERLLRRLTPKEVSLIIEHGALEEARVDRAQLELALLALTLNAAESSPQGGEVRVSLQVREGGGGAPELRLAVEDEGPPTPLADLSALIDSYAPPEEGGEDPEALEEAPALVRVHALMREVGGALHLSRHAGRNRAVATWPLLGTPLPRATRRAETEEAAGARVLLVDDNHELRRALARQLASLGHTVESFGDPLEALAALPRLSPPPDLLITDVIMPGLNGRQLADEARALLPALPVLFISGYTSDVLGEVGGARADEALLHKPFTKEVLRRKVLQLLRRE